mmetsp:Transcript_72472/g.212383  ORF Transcript_72472/g.212383 Transcript_72472/m.212383 type:complete len:272 (+) Transcript_72472:452-1267(+)
MVDAGLWSRCGLRQRLDGRCGLRCLCLPLVSLIPLPLPVPVGLPRDRGARLSGCQLCLPVPTAGGRGDLSGLLGLGPVSEERGHARRGTVARDSKPHVLRHRERLVRPASLLLLALLALLVLGLLRLLRGRVGAPAPQGRHAQTVAGARQSLPPLGRRGLGLLWQHGCAAALAGVVRRPRLPRLREAGGQILGRARGLRSLGLRRPAAAPAEAQTQFLRGLPGVGRRGRGAVRPPLQCKVPLDTHKFGQVDLLLPVLLRGRRRGACPSVAL